MDDYIYFRVLDHLMKHQKATLSDLVLAAGLNWKRNPVKFLYVNGFLDEVKGLKKGATYFMLTSKGRLLHSKMKIFYDTFEESLTIVNTKLRVREDW